MKELIEKTISYLEAILLTSFLSIFAIPIVILGCYVLKYAFLFVMLLIYKIL
jgi:hypothetical protein